LLTDSTVTFASLNLASPILEALTQEGYTNPTPIQSKTIPATLAGRDVLGCAQTGTGKTAAFALPILHKLLTEPRDKSHRGRPLARALILSPTRELATQIAESFKTYGRHTGVSGTIIFGGVGQGPQVRDLQRGIDVIVATPGRLLDLMDQGHVDLSGVTTFVLDEADRMLDMGFITPIRTIAAQVPTNRQMLLFSATMPREIQHLAESLMRDPVRVAVTPVASAAPKIEQRLYMVPRQQKLGLLLHLMETEKATRAVVFSKTKHGSDKLCKRLVQMGIPATAIHGNKAQNQRDRALDAFKMGRVRVLVATDVAARGLDVDHISHVFNFDLPMEPEAYVHRIGRTGRAGASGVAISFCDHEERDLLRQIERLAKKPIPSFPLPSGVMLNVPLRDPNEAADRHPASPHAGHRAGHHPGDDRHPERKFHPAVMHLREQHDHPAAPAGDRRLPPHHPLHPQNTERSNSLSGHPLDRPLRSPHSKRPGGKPAGKFANTPGGKPGGRPGGHQRGGSNASNSTGAGFNPKDKGKPKWAAAGKGKAKRR
jgi:ATP-dependent RNA helicase RhlE